MTSWWALLVVHSVAQAKNKWGCRSPRARPHVLVVCHRLLRRRTMSVVRWSDAELREFVLAAPRLDRGEEITAGVARRAFPRQFVASSVASIQHRMLARVGAMTASEGITVFACDLLENSSCDP